MGADMTRADKCFHGLLVVLLSVMLLLGITEIGMRFLPKNIKLIRKNERSLLYRYDEELGWFPIENSKRRFTTTPRFEFSRDIEIEHNSRGFRDPEPVITAKPKIVFLGDSFVWGYNVTNQERFTDKLRERLPDWSLYNFGISGYGTDQEYLLLTKQFQFYLPDIVFLVFCAENDRDDNSHNVRYGRYYKPYFTVDGDNLTLNGTPVPKAENYFIASHEILAHSYWFALLANAYFRMSSPPAVKLADPTHRLIARMNHFVKTRGAEFLVGLTGADPELEKFLQGEGIRYADLSTPYRYPSDGYHWTPEGHSHVSEKIYDFLTKASAKDRVWPGNRSP